MHYAGVGSRAVATIVDSIVMFVVFFAIAAATGQTTEEGFELTGVPFFLATGVYFLYYIALEALSGATLGKRIVGLRVVREDGGGIGWRESVIRNLLRFVDGLFLYLVGAVLVWTSAKRQRLGDRIAETVVVRGRKASAGETSAQG